MVLSLVNPKEMFINSNLLEGSIDKRKRERYQFDFFF